MSDYSNQASLENAEEIIERFGGIRPMANKMRVPVTTVQGWKKRKAIPGSRKEEILDAADRNGIDLSDFPQFAANQNGFAKDSVQERKEQTKGEKTAVSKEEEPVTLTSRDEIKGSASAMSRLARYSTTEELLAKMRGVEKKAVRQSAWIATALVVLAIAAGAFVMWPTAQKVDSHGRRINALEQDVARIDGEVGALKEKQGLLSRVLPEDFDLENIQRRAESLQKMVGTLVDTADAASRDILEGSGGETLPERVRRLETQMRALAENTGFSHLIARMDEFKETVSGRKLLDKSVNQLNAVVEGLQGQKSQLDDALIVAREESEALGKTFEGVSNEDLKAAAMLLAFSQVRDALNRGQTPFEEDLELLMNMVGDDNPELKEALEKLAPHADEGVLSTEGLSEEFRGLAGDIVIASLKGEDVSIQEKAKARLNEILQVEKEGELLTGTDTQATVARAENRLSSGDLQGAIAELQNLQGDAATAAMPFMDKANAALQAQQAKKLITSFIRSNLGTSRAKYTTKMKGFSSLVPSPSVIRDPESGVSVLPPKPSLPE